MERRKRTGFKRLAKLLILLLKSAGKRIDFRPTVETQIQSSESVLSPTRVCFSVDLKKVKMRSLKYLIGGVVGVWG